MLRLLRLTLVLAVVAAGTERCEGIDRVLAFPVLGEAPYIDAFGAARSGGRTHKGQDMIAPKGTLLLAAVDGTVTRVLHTNTGIAGNVLEITDEDGWRYIYMHLNNDTPGTDNGRNLFEQAFADGMRVGQRVKMGEPVGFMGDSGNAEGEFSQLHFEMRTPADDAIDPIRSLELSTRTVLSIEELDAAAPIGEVDLVDTPSPGVIRSQGYAIDRSGDVAVPVSIYIDGKPAITAVASNARADLSADYPELSPNHGFDISVGGIRPGIHGVCAVFHNAGAGGGSRRVGCSIVVVP